MVTGQELEGPDRKWLGESILIIMRVSIDRVLVEIFLERPHDNHHVLLLVDGTALDDDRQEDLACAGFNHGHDRGKRDQVIAQLVFRVKQHDHLRISIFS